MGYRGKVEEQERARELRAAGMTLLDIATELGVTKSSVSLWVRDVDFTPSTAPLRRTTPPPPRSTKPSSRQIEELDAGGRRPHRHLERRRLPRRRRRALRRRGIEDATARSSSPTPTPTMVRVLLCVAAAVLRRSTSRGSGSGSTSTRVSISTPPSSTGRRSRTFRSSQFRAPYRAVADPSIRRNKHEFGCVYVSYSCTTTHRRIMGLVRALLSSDAIPG